VVLAARRVAPESLRLIFGTDPTRTLSRDRPGSTGSELRAAYVFDPPRP
jgi:hypothetical protein